MLFVVKVTVLTEGGSDIGLGHITRCVSIYQALENVGVQPEMLINGDESVTGLLRDIRCEIFNWLGEEGQLFEKIKGADIVIIDSYLAGLDLYEKISKVAETVVYFDDDLRMNYPKGIVINGAVLAEQMPYPKREDVTYLLGTQYTPLRKEFWDVHPKEIRCDIETIMVTFGGSDIRNLTPKVLNCLDGYDSGVNKKVIIADGYNNSDEIEGLQLNNVELFHSLGASEMKELMIESDAAISACGQTLYELARTGLPTIAVMVADNQKYNVKGWRESGFLKHIFNWDNPVLTDKIAVALEDIQSLTTRQKLCQAGEGFVDGKGAARIIQTIMKDLYESSVSDK